MSLAKLQKFIQYIKDTNIMAADDIVRAVRQMSMFDRRLGQLSAFRGFIQPDQINVILLEQSRSGGLFGETAVRLKLMTPQQVDLILKLQKDDLFLFAQAAVTQKLTTTEKIIGHIKTFLGSNPELVKEAAQGPTQEKLGLDLQIRTVLKSIEEIAPLPATAAKAIVMLEDSKANLEEVGKVLSLDPGLSSTILRVVNSAFYGMRDRITSVGKAVVVMGIKKLRQIVIAASVMQKFQAVPQAFAQTFWERAVRTGEWSKTMAEAKRMDEVDEMFICGLLHDVGRILMAQYFRSHLTKIDQIMAGGKKMLDAERSVLGGTHADLGGYLFNVWRLPKETVQCAMFHHHDLQLLVNTPNLSEQVFVVHMASSICDIDPNLDALGYGEQLDQLSRRYAGPLKLNTNTLNMDKLAEKVDANYGNLLATFSGKG